MYARISKEYSWAMSHRLPFHQGVCKNIHGHAYKIRLTVGGEVDANGMLIDFYDLDGAVKPLINQLDHAFICDENDTELKNFVIQNNFKHYILPFNTTAENVGGFMLVQFAESLKTNTNLDYIGIRFYETDDAFAELEMKLK